MATLQFSIRCRWYSDVPFISMMYCISSKNLRKRRFPAWAYLIFYKGGSSRGCSYPFVIRLLIVLMQVINWKLIKRKGWWKSNVGSVRVLWKKHLITSILDCSTGNISLIILQKISISGNYCYQLKNISRIVISPFFTLGRLGNTYCSFCFINS